MTRRSRYSLRFQMSLKYRTTLKFLMCHVFQKNQKNRNFQLLHLNQKYHSNRYYRKFHSFLKCLRYLTYRLNQKFLNYQSKFHPVLKYPMFLMNHFLLKNPTHLMFLKYLMNQRTFRLTQMSQTYLKYHVFRYCHLFLKSPLSLKCHSNLTFLQNHSCPMYHESLLNLMCHLYP